MAIHIDNSAVDRLLRDAREDALNDAGTRVTSRSQEEAPVRSGNLRRNIEWEPPTGDMKEGAVMANAPYSTPVHEGWKRIQRSTSEDGEEIITVVASYAGNPFMTRALEAVSKGG